MSKVNSFEAFETLFTKIEELINPLGFSYKKPKDLAKNIVKLSNLFIEENQNKTPWEEPWAEAAYLAYYTPLNYWRWTHLLERIHQSDIFSNIDNILDFGCGSGSASLAVSDLIKSSINFKGYDTSILALNYYKKFLPGSETSNKDFGQKLSNSDTSIVLASYVLNELESTPNILQNSKNIIIMEPSTQVAARRLMRLKSSLEEDQFHTWGPCTHSNVCPMLEDEGNWCHQRTTPLPSSPLKSLENFLPIKNNTLTYSYLMVSKKTKPHPENYIAVVSDEQKEKGKTRYLTCGSKGLNWLSHLKRDKLGLDLKRGDRALLDFEKLEQKKTELRIKDSNSVVPSPWLKDD